MTGTKVGTVEEDEVTDNATMVRCNFQFHVKKNLYFLTSGRKMIFAFGII